MDSTDSNDHRYDPPRSDQPAPQTTAHDYQLLTIPDGDLVYYRTFFPQAPSDEFFALLRDTTTWKQESIKLFGKTVDIPRLTAWYGEPGKVYSYSGITVEPHPWTPTLLSIKREIEAVSGVVFNSVLLNLYRSERDSVSWHSDDEPELGTNPVIGSVSFGSCRRFQLRHKRDKEQKLQLDLTHGSYLLMRGATQHHWMHQIPKASKPCGERINLTFRIIW